MIGPISQFNTFLAASGSSTSSKLARSGALAGAVYHQKDPEHQEEIERQGSRREDAVALKLRERSDLPEPQTYSSKGEFIDRSELEIPADADKQQSENREEQQQFERRTYYPLPNDTGNRLDVAA